MNTQDANNKQVKVALPARHMPGIAVTTGVRGGMTKEQAAEYYCHRARGPRRGAECAQCLVPFIVELDGGEVRPEPVKKLFECARIEL